MDTPDSYKTSRIDSAHILKAPSLDNEEINEKEETFFSEEELIQMYGEVPSEAVLQKENIHVYK